jgi:hypothetical protein
MLRTPSRLEVLLGQFLEMNASAVMVPRLLLRLLVYRSCISLSRSVCPWRSMNDITQFAVLVRPLQSVTQFVVHNMLKEQLRSLSWRSDESSRV